MRVTYETYGSLREYRASIERRYTRRDVDFMDGIIRSPTQCVLSLGEFVHRAPYTHRYDWVTPYYQTTATRRQDYLRTRDYLFRYDRGVTNPTPRSALGRFVLGRFLSSANLLRLAEKFNHLLPAERPGVTLDLFLPISRMEDFLAWHTREIGHYPLWCVPYKRTRDYEWIAPSFYENNQDELFVDLPIYGMAQPVGRNIYREIEVVLPRFNAIKTLISFNYYSEDEFWGVFNRANYEAVKATTDPGHHFRDLYTKTCRAAQGLGWMSRDRVLDPVSTVRRLFQRVRSPGRHACECIPRPPWISSPDAVVCSLGLRAAACSISDDVRQTPTTRSAAPRRE